MVGDAMSILAIITTKTLTGYAASMILMSKPVTWKWNG